MGRSISKSKHLLAAHLSNNELVEEIHDGYPLKLELLSILGINFQHFCSFIILGRGVPQNW